MKLFRALGAAMVLVLTPLVLVPVALAPAAHADDDITKHLISNPNVGSYQIYGPQTNKKVKDAAVQGGTAIEVSVSGVGLPYAAAAQVEVNQKIIKGDDIVCAVWIKAKSADGAPVRLHGRLQINAAPYTAAGETDFNVTDQWQLYSLELTADQDYDKNKLVFVVHLNTAKQVIDLGPAFVLNMTRTY